MKKAILSTLAIFLFSACASTIPEPVRTPPSGDLDLTTVLGKHDQFDGDAVRWGGTIASVENHEDETWIEIVAHRLSRKGRPLSDYDSEGRFMAVVEGFADPAIYTQDRKLTVAGTLDGSTAKSIGDFDYVYPVVRASSFYLWKPLPKTAPYPHHPYPYPYYDPWYSPHRHLFKRNHW